MTDQPLTILITSIGSRAAEGVVASLGRLRQHIRLVVTNSTPEAPGLYDADAAYLVPLTANHAGFVARLGAIIESEQPRLVISGRDEEVTLLAAMAEAPAGHGKTQFLVPPAAIAPIFNDKYQTAVFANRHGLPFAPTACSRTELDHLIAEHGFPIVSKPRVGGFASRDVRVLFTPEQADRALHLGGLVFQPFLGLHQVEEDIRQWSTGFGEPWLRKPNDTSHMIDFVLGQDGALLALCASVAQRSGTIVQRLTRCDDPALLACAHRHVEVLRRFGLRGPLNIQGVLDPQGRFVAFEWNARFVGSTPGYAQLGVNLVDAALRHYLPELQSVPVVPTTELIPFRSIIFRAVPLCDIETLKQAGHWSGPGGH